MNATARKPTTARARPRSGATRRSRGRPSGGDAAVREALLEAARRLFLARGFSAVSIRELAAAAGANPAMIHYYFGDKLGLYRAMLETAVVPFRAALEEMRTRNTGEGFDIRVLIRLYMHTLAANPWIPQLIVQEVLAEGGRFRSQFIENFAGRLAPMFVEVLEREQAAGRLRADVDPKLAAVSVISLCVFPFVSLPVTSRVLGLSVEGDSLERLVTHTGNVLLQGLGHKESAA
jgi:TetR/AcrR family transcriptional regulator